MTITRRLTIIILLTLLITISAGCERKQPVVIHISQSQTLPGELSVSIVGGLGNNTPDEHTSLSETIQGKSFIGVLVTGKNDRVKVLAARENNGEASIHIITQTTRQLSLIVRPPGNPSPTPIEKSLPPGTHDFHLTHFNSSQKNAP